MRIMQVKPSRVFGQDIWNKWYCSDSIPGPDGDPVHRYLQEDGTWGKTTHYFDNEDAVRHALHKGQKPDFRMSRQEFEDRAMIREDVERGFADMYDDDNHRGYPDDQL